MIKIYKFGDKVQIVSEGKLRQLDTTALKHKFANKIGTIIDFQTRRKNRMTHTVYVICLLEDNPRDYVSKVNNVEYGSTGYIWYDDEIMLYNKNKRIVEVM